MRIRLYGRDFFEIMKINYKKPGLERYLVSVNLVAATVAAATFVSLYGFHEPLLKIWILHLIQFTMLAVFVSEKVIRFYNAVSKREYLRVNWFEVPLLVVFVLSFLAAGQWYSFLDPDAGRMLSLGVYLILQVVAKACHGCVNLAASGENPTKALIGIFLALIIVGASLLCLPKSYVGEPTSPVDALFTATSATCVTGLIVEDTGSHFSFMGQIVILSLIQLGGLGIVIFGAVLALLLGQALSIRESVAMQDLLSAQTLGRIGNIIGFIFVTTILLEALGALGLMGMWPTDQTVADKWFFSIFHSISAFCNAGFSLYEDSLVGFSGKWQVYGVISSLIILGGLGFGVLYDIAAVTFDYVKRHCRKKGDFHDIITKQAPRKVSLQTKLVLSTSAILIVLGAVALLLLENNSLGSHQNQASGGQRFLSAIFQSVTTRTAGFNSVDISQMSPASKQLMMVLMFIGGSPGSTAGGIKTVTLAVILMVAYATLKKRSEVDVFKRSVSVAVAGRAITVVLLFALVFLFVSFALSITERQSGFAMSDIMFETMSALGTVGLSCGITAELTTAGKLLIIATMLIGRLGPLTLLAAMTFNLKPAGYSYPEEPIIVG